MENKKEKLPILIHLSFTAEISAEEYENDLLDKILNVVGEKE
jgi:hypothetical protein